jgi:hypothetical protein
MRGRRFPRPEPGAAERDYFVPAFAHIGKGPE